MGTPEKGPSPDNFFEIYVVNLDGSNKQVIDRGRWPSLSPDGTKAAYMRDDGLYLADLATNESHLIPNTKANDYSPQWSPDGKRLAFVRGDDVNLYLISPDGTGLQRVINEIEHEHLVGWSPDGASLFYGVDTQQGLSLRKLDIAASVISNLFTINLKKGPSVAISPAGNRIAFHDRVNDLPYYNLYVSRMDGSDRKLVGETGFGPVWSPDSNWLLVNVWDSEHPSTETAESVPTLVNVENCQIIPLPFRGEVHTWIP